MFDLAVVVTLGAVLGLGSAQFAVSGKPAIGRVDIGPWQSWPAAGRRDGDPYMRAHLARGIHLPLGSGEAIELVAERDESGARLDGRCRYRVAGPVPTSRGWTLGVTDPAGRSFELPLARAGFSDAEIVRDEAGNLVISLDSQAVSGNWLPLPASGPFQLRLRIYDTPVSGQAGELRPDLLPSIVRQDCA